MGIHRTGIGRFRHPSILALGVVGIVGAVLALWQGITASPSVTSVAAPSEGASVGGQPQTRHLTHEASPSSGSPPVTLPDSHVDPRVARQVALEHGRGRNNAFVDDRMFLATALSDGRLSVKALKSELLSIEELQALPSDVRVLKDKPAAVVERMAMIDTLEALIEDDPTALAALAELASTPIDSSLPVQAKRAVAAEKYDVFVALARNNWELAKQTYLNLNSSALMALLKPALIGGLVDSGLSRAQAITTVDSLTPAPSRDG
jgi:hypothetical protein